MITYSSTGEPIVESQFWPETLYTYPGKSPNTGETDFTCPSVIVKLCFYRNTNFMYSVNSVEKHTHTHTTQVSVSSQATHKQGTRKHAVLLYTGWEFTDPLSQHCQNTQLLPFNKQSVQYTVYVIKESNWSLRIACLISSRLLPLNQFSVGSGTVGTLTCTVVLSAVPHPVYDCVD